MPTEPSSTSGSVAVMLTPAQIIMVRRIIDTVIPGAEVGVFGSRATGRARPFSDLDLLVIRPARLSWLQRAELRDRFEASELPFRVDVVEAEGLTGATADRVRRESVVLQNQRVGGADSRR